MPRHPQLSQPTQRISGSVFSALAGRLRERFPELYPFHLGDTYLPPADGARLEDLATLAHPGLHNYSPPRGRFELIAALLERSKNRTGCALEPGNLYVTAGATAGLCATFYALLEPGDEVLLLAPYWPLIAGIAHTCRTEPVAVPVVERDSVVDVELAIERLEHATNERTALLYLSSPNNPSGRVLPREWIERVVAWAAQRGLWIVSDEVYEDFVYRGEHTSCYPLAPERVIASHSFSKAYGMAGNRCGWLLGPSTALAAVERIGSHTFYSTPTGAQIAALAALERGAAWQERARSEYRRAGTDAAELLGVAPPDGGTFLFLDLAEALGSRELSAFLERCADRGLFLAPGPSFGDYPSSVRLCFTALPYDATLRGVTLLRDLIAEGKHRATQEPTNAAAKEGTTP